jgi:putrescine transport system ATP-binding protein
MPVNVPINAPQDPVEAAEARYIHIENVSKAFEEVWAVDDVSLSIRRGEIFALLGGSGCGKSTLLRMLAGFETLTSGDIFLDGEAIKHLPPHRRPVNMMFQNYALFPHMTVEQNIAFGLKQTDMHRQDIADKVVEMLHLVHMMPYARRKPHQLSGGQQQRVALARSLAKQPKMLLLDEPMGALDKKLRVQMQLEVVDIIEQAGVTCIMVTHDQEEAMTMASRIAVMNEGRILQVGTPDEIYEQPANRYTAEFIGSVNIIEGRLKASEPDHAIIESDAWEGDIYVGHGVTEFQDQDVAYAIRPEKVLMSKNSQALRNSWKARVDDIAYFGSHSIYLLELLESGFRLRVQLAHDERWANEAFTWDDIVTVGWSDDAGVVLTS